VLENPVGGSAPDPSRLEQTRQEVFAAEVRRERGLWPEAQRKGVSRKRQHTVGKKGNARSRETFGSPVAIFPTSFAQEAIERMSGDGREMNGHVEKRATKVRAAS